MNLPASHASAANSRPRNSDHRRIFRCDGYGDCSMSFTRAEHLARHIRKHTGDRPFRCDVCHKFFSRADNLRQHRDAVHAGQDANTADRSSSSTMASHITSLRPRRRKSRLRNSTQSCPQLYPTDLQLQPQPPNAPNAPNAPSFLPNVSHDVLRNDSMDLPALTSLALLPTPGSYEPSQKYSPWFPNPDMAHMSSGPRLSGLPPLGIRAGAVSAATTTPTVPPATGVNAQYPLNSYVGTNLPIIYTHTPLRRARSLNSYPAVWAATGGLFTAGPLLMPEEQAVPSYIPPEHQQHEQQQQQQLGMVLPQTHPQAPPQSHPEHGFNHHGAL